MNEELLTYTADATLFLNYKTSFLYKSREFEWPYYVVYFKESKCS